MDSSRIGQVLQRRRAALLLAGAGLALYAIQSVAWPVHGGRDAQDYLIYYLDVWHAEPVYPALMLLRTPVAPLFLGPPLDIGGPTGLEFALAAAYASSIVAFAAAAAAWGRTAAVATAVALLLYPAYGGLFHLVASEPVFALGLALWTLFVVRTLLAPTTLKFVLHGAAVFALVLTRPSSQLLLLFALVPLLASSAPVRSRLRWCGAFLATALTLLVGWAFLNAIRYDDFTVARNVGAVYPLGRLFAFDRLVSPENGPASRELAAAVEQDLLPFEPYRSSGIDVREFFGSGSLQMWADLAAVSDRRWGWDTDYGKLREVSVEAIRAHPRVYLRRVAATTRDELLESFTVLAPRRSGSQGGEQGGASTALFGRRGPGGEPIATSRLWWLATTPDGRIKPAWRSPAQPGMSFGDAADERRAARLAANVSRLQDDLPPRDGSTAVARVLNRISELYPPMPVWLAIGAVGLLVRRVRRGRLLAALPVLGLTVIVVTLAGQPPITAYRVPFDPVFILFGVVGVLGASDGLRFRGAREPRARRRNDAGRVT